MNTAINEIDGVEVLNIINHTNYGFGVNKILIILLVCVIIGIIFVILGSSRKNDFLMIVGILIALLCGILSIISFCMAKETGKWQSYEVYFADTVDMKEFSENYEIIKQKGRIFEIKEIKKEE